MEIKTTKSFDKDFLKLPNEIKIQTKKQLALFTVNFRHPSLQIKKIKGLVNTWEGRVTRNYRFIFKVINNICFLVKVGPHDLLRKIRNF